MCRKPAAFELLVPASTSVFSFRVLSDKKPEHTSMKLDQLAKATQSGPARLIAFRRIFLQVRLLLEGLSGGGQDFRSSDDAGRASTPAHNARVASSPVFVATVLNSGAKSSWHVRTVQKTHSLVFATSRDLGSETQRHRQQQATACDLLKSEILKTTVISFHSV